MTLFERLIRAVLVERLDWPVIPPLEPGACNRVWDRTDGLPHRWHHTECKACMAALRRLRAAETRRWSLTLWRWRLDVTRAKPIDRRDGAE